MIEGNLGPGERRKRFVLAVVALAGACGLILAGSSGALYQRLLLFILFWIAGLGLVQAKEKT